MSIVIGLVFLGLYIFYAYRVVQGTGLLTITTSDLHATITISGNKTTAAIIGTGNTKVRLKPGSYLIVAGNQGMQASQVVTVSKGNKADIKLQLVQPAVIPSPDTVSYDNVQTLLDYGLNPAQVANVKQVFFQYKTSTKTISIDSSSVKQEPHNPAGNDPFKLDFNATLDGTTVKAVVVYSSFDDIQMQIYDPSSGALLYSGSSVPTGEGT